LLSLALLVAVPMSGQPVVYEKRSAVSDVMFRTTNTGIFGLSVTTGSSGFVVPRGSTKAYMFGSGIWFGARKTYGGETRDLVFITYNPSTGGSWAWPGEGYLTATPGAGPVASPDLFHSTDYDHQTGEYTGTPGGPAPATKWPLWLLPGESAAAMHPGRFAPYDNQRVSGGPDGYQGPAFVPGADEQFVARFHDNNLQQYRLGDSATARAMGYPIGLQVQEDIYAWKDGPLKDAVILSCMFINTSPDVLHDCVVGHIWDPDLGLPTDDAGAFYAHRPELRTAFNWSDVDGPVRYGALMTTLIAAPVVDASGFIDNRRRAEFREGGRVGTFRNWTIEEEPVSSTGRYDFITSSLIDQNYDPGDRRGLLATRKFSMRPGDTAYFAIGIAVIPESPIKTRKAEGGAAIAADDTSADLERVAEEELAFYYRGEGIASVPVTPVIAADRLSLLPNPARDRVAIGFTLHAPGGATINLVDGMGKIVATRRLDGLDAGEHRGDLDVSGVAPGAYIITVTTAGGLSTGKLTVIR
jgi:hypothetical protein